MIPFLSQIIFALAIGATGALGAYLYLEYCKPWVRESPPSNHVLTIKNPDGIPIRTVKLPVRGVARLCTHLDEQWYD